MSGIINSAGSKSGVIGTTEIDYEEGRFTPSVFAGSTNISTSPDGYYIKIGKLVYIFMILNMYKGANTGAFKVTTPPFAFDSTYPTTSSFRGNDNVNLDRVSSSVGTSEFYFYLEPHSTSTGLATLQAETLLPSAPACSMVMTVVYKALV
jgi:hypothetical protein